MKIFRKIISYYKRNWKEITGALFSLIAIILTTIELLNVPVDEYRRCLFNERFKLYLELMERSSELCNYIRSADSVEITKFEDAMTRYSEFQNGKLMLVNDDSIGIKVNSLIFKIREYRYEPTKSGMSLLNSLGSLNKYCNSSLKRTFNESLNEYNERKTIIDTVLGYDSNFVKSTLDIDSSVVTFKEFKKNYN